MRQSTRAVALLLSSTQAAITNLSAIAAGQNFYYTGQLTQERPTLGTGVGGTLNAFQDRRAAYAPNLTVNSITYNWGAATAQSFSGKSATTTAQFGTTVAAGVGVVNLGSGCPLCVNGGGVWCSRTYAYDQTNAAYQYAQTATATTTFQTNFNTSSSEASGTTDQGACCQGSSGSAPDDLFQTILGKVGTAPTTQTAAA